MLYKRNMTSKLIASRVDAATFKELKEATDRKRNPYAPNLSQIVVRGIRLALDEHRAAKAEKEGSR